MKLKLKHVLAALAIAVVLGVTYVMNFGLYPRFFDISWDEEVQLHDGRVIVVHVKNTYERRNRKAAEYDEISSQFRQKELSFERSLGQTYTLKTRMPISYLGQFGEKWYVVISGQGPYGNFPDEMPDHWGMDYTTREQRIAVLDNEAFRPISWEMAPAELRKMNLMQSAFFKEFLIWRGYKLTLSQKLAFDKKYPTPDQDNITRPIRMNAIKKDAK